MPRLLSERHPSESDQGAGVLDLAHVAKGVLIDPTFDGVTARDSRVSAHARRERLSHRRSVGGGDDDVGECRWIDGVDELFSGRKHQSLELEERWVVAD